MLNLLKLFSANKLSKYQMIKENLDSKLPNLKGDIYNLETSLTALRIISKEIDFQSDTLKGNMTEEERVELQDLLYHDFFNKCYKQIEIRFKMVHELGKDNAVHEIITLERNIEQAINKITEFLDYPRDLQLFNDYHTRAIGEYISICESIITEITAHIKNNNLLLYTYFNKNFVNKYTSMPCHNPNLADQADRYFTILYLLNKTGLNDSGWSESDQHTLNNLLFSLGCTTTEITIVSPYDRVEITTELNL